MEIKDALSVYAAGGRIFHAARALTHNRETRSPPCHQIAIPRTQSIAPNTFIA